MSALRALVGSLLLGGVLLCAIGCQTPSRTAEPAGDEPRTIKPADEMSHSDAQRATENLEEQRSERANKRHPYQPPPDRVVNQPPAGVGQRR